MTRSAHDLVDLAYSALLGQTSWQAFLDQLMQVAQVDCATLFYHDAPSGRGAVTLSAGMPDWALRDYASHFAARNPWMRHLERMPVGETFLGEQFIAQDRFRNTEFYQDHLRQLDLETGVGVTIERGDGRFLLLSTLSGDIDPERNRQRAGVLSSLAPHIRRIAALHHRQRLDGLGRGLSMHLGDVEGIAVVFVDATGRIVHVNGAAQTLLARGGVAGQGSHGLLQFRSKALQERLRGVLSGAPPPRAMIEHGLEIAFLPVGRGDGAHLFLGPSVAVLFSRRNNDIRLLASRYGLTKAEIRVAMAIIDGRKPQAIADLAGVSIGTVRSQLKAIFAKTGARGQAHLVSIAAGLAADSDPLA